MVVFIVFIKVANDLLLLILLITVTPGVVAVIKIILVAELIAEVSVQYVAVLLALVL